MPLQNNRERFRASIDYYGGWEVDDEVVYRRAVRFRAEFNVDRECSIQRARQEFPAHVISSLEHVHAQVVVAEPPRGVRTRNTRANDRNVNAPCCSGDSQNMRAKKMKVSCDQYEKDMK